MLTADALVPPVLDEPLGLLDARCPQQRRVSRDVLPTPMLVNVAEHDRLHDAVGGLPWQVVADFIPLYALQVRFVRGKDVTGYEHPSGPKLGFRPRDD